MSDGGWSRTDLSGGPSAGRFTNHPSPTRPSTMSTSSSATRASRTGARLTPKRWASSRSVGRRSPARYSPSLMTDLSWSIIWTYNFLDLIGVTGTLRLLGLHIAWLPGCQTSLPPLSGHLLLETEFSNFLLLYDNV